MRKKRYIKLLMATGVQRNQAQRLAQRANPQKSYQSLWADDAQIRFAFSMRRTFKMIVEASRAFGVAVSEMMIGFKRGLTK